MPSEFVYLLEVDGYTDTAAYETRRYSMREREGYRTKPTDTPPSTPYFDRLVNAALISRSMFAGGLSVANADPRASIGVVVAELIDTDGSLQPVFGSPATTSFNERAMRVLRVRPGAAYSTAETVIKAVISQPQMSGDTKTGHRIKLNAADRLYELDTPHLTTTYAGNNALPAGVEGGPELAGKLKPCLLGKAFQIPAICVNTSKLIYQVHDGAIQSIDAVRDKGDAYTSGADYTSQADMEATAPAAGQYRVWPAGGMFRVGGSTPTALTCDATADTTANSKAGTLLSRLAQRKLSAGDISSSDVTALDAANGAVLGSWFADSRTTRSIMDDVARTVGAYYGLDRLQVLRMQRVEDPASLPAGALQIAQWNTATIETVVGADAVPVTEVRIRFARYHQTQSGSDLSSTVTAAARLDYGEEWRVAKQTASLSPNPHRRTNTLEIETLFAFQADAAAEASRRVTMLKTPHRMHWLRDVELDDDALLNLDINQTIGVRWNLHPFSRDTLTPRLVLAVSPKDLAAGKCDVLIWGT